MHDVVLRREVRSISSRVVGGSLWVNTIWRVVVLVGVRL